MTKTVTMAAATAGRAEGGTTLNAFDNALLAAGIGNINLIKVSSILPPRCRVVDAAPDQAGRARAHRLRGHDQRDARRDRRRRRRLGPAGRSRQERRHHGVPRHRPPEAEAERQIVQMLEEAFRVRGETIRDMQVFAVEHRVERTGCALAAVTLLSDEDLV